MRLPALAFAVMVALGAGVAHARPELVYFGTHTTTAAQLPAGQPLPDPGIYGAWFDPDSGRFTALGRVVDLTAPTWLSGDTNRPILYSVVTGSAGSQNLVALAVDPKTGALIELNRGTSGGGDATYLFIDAKSQSLLTANYATGQVSAVALTSDGRLGAMASIQSETGTGPSPRQTAPHAHSVVLDPSGRYALAADLGADKVFVYRFDPATRGLTPAATPFEATPPGTGPRHLAFHPNGRYVYLVSELSAEVRTYGWDAATGQLQLVQTLSLAAPGYDGKKSGGEIAVSDDGRFLYVSERGESQILVYAIDAGTGQLKEIQRLASAGVQPWQFSFDPSRKWFLVANETSNAITVFKVDPHTGLLTLTAETLTVPRPVTVTFATMK